MIRPAIVVVGYNRPATTKRLLEYIGKAYYEFDDIPLIVSIDESDLSDEVQKVAEEFNWEHGTKEIKRFPQKQGLRRHIIQCGDYAERYGAVIILEDDLIVSDDFYSYVCQAHAKYNNDERICGVSLYSFDENQFTYLNFKPQRSIYDVYLGEYGVTWGQSWTKNQWQKFKAWYIEHEDKLPEHNDNIPYEVSSWTRSWGRYFASYIAENHLSYVYPYIAHSTCFSEVGEHNVSNEASTCFQVPLANGHKEYLFADYDKLVRYDAFYERILGKNIEIAGITGEDICLDLYNTKVSTLGKNYVITNSKLNGQKQIATFGLSLRPIEMNVISEVSGDDFYMYKLVNPNAKYRDYPKLPYIHRYNHHRIGYEFFELKLENSFKYTIEDFKIRVKNKLNRIFK